jgi:tRNA modification GTPase
LYTTSNTIVAHATPSGEGAIGIIRLSGNEAISIVQKIWKGKNLLVQPSHTLHFGRIMSGTTTIDEVVVSLYKNPRSYTGEDVVEISCHGSGYVLEKILALCAENGAVYAKPGEFTQRAFLNGKLDLTQAEAVADLIASQSSAAHQAAIHNLRGGFSHDLKAIREELIKFSALIELELDFSQEDVEFADRSQFLSLIQNSKLKIQNLLDSFHLGNVIKQGVKVAIIGKPNVGKSTLLNALLNEERAIVSEIAGTTRDTIEETLNINGVLFRLIDTAGIREHTSDVIESIGIERSKKAMLGADIVVYIFDLLSFDEKELSQAIDELQQSEKTFIVVGNKADLVIEKRQANFSFEIISLSAKNNTTQVLRDALFQKATDGKLNTEGTIITNARHYAALKEVMQSLQDVQSGFDNNIPSDLIALDIRHCLYYLGEITGEITTEDKLDYIFSKFCIGK